MTALSGAAGSGILLFAAFPGYGMAMLAWFGLIPLLLVIRGRSSLSAAITAQLCGMVFSLGVFSWILVVPGYNAIHHCLLAVYLGSYVGLFGLLFSILDRKLGTFAALLTAPFIWVALEYVRSNFLFLALPWGLLAHSQYQTVMLIQSASVAGVHGVAFLIVAANCAGAALILYGLCRLGGPRFSDWPALTFRSMSVIAGAAFVLLAAAMVFGHLQISKTIAGERLDIALIQGNISLAQKRNPDNADGIMDVYVNLSRRAAVSAPDLIVWPENATPGSLSGNHKLFSRIAELGAESGSHLIVGSSSLHKFDVRQLEKSTFTNSAFLIAPTPGPTRVRKYDKIRLFPFGEYLPYRERIPWSLIGVPDIPDYRSGVSYRVFYLDHHPFSVTICWENLFSNMVRQFVRNGAQFIVNITNEAWFGETAAPYQFLSMNVFRAVENGVFLLRCANTGISGIIDPCGRILDRVKNGSGKDNFIRGYLTGQITPLRSSTFYTRYGDWFAWFCAAVASIMVAAAVFRKAAPPANS